MTKTSNHFSDYSVIETRKDVYKNIPVKKRRRQMPDGKRFNTIELPIADIKKLIQWHDRQKFSSSEHLIQTLQNTIAALKQQINQPQQKKQIIPDYR